VGTRCADHVTPLYPQKLALTSPTGGGRSVGIVHSRTKATECGENISFDASLVIYTNSINIYPITIINKLSRYRPEQAHRVPGG